MIAKTMKTPNNPAQSPLPSNRAAPHAIPKIHKKPEAAMDLLRIGFCSAAA